MFLTACGGSEGPGDGSIEVHCDPAGPGPAVFAAAEGCLIEKIAVAPPCYVSECESPDAASGARCNLAQVYVRPPFTRPESSSATLECDVAVQAGSYTYHTRARFEAGAQSCAVSDGLSWHWEATSSDPVTVPCSAPVDGGPQDAEQD